MLKVQRFFETDTRWNRSSYDTVRRQPVEQEKMLRLDDNKTR